MTRVLVSHQHRLMRAGMGLILEDALMDVVGEAPGGEEVVKLTRVLRPDVVLVDVRSPAADGIAVIRRIRSGHSMTAVLVVAEQGGMALLRAAFEAGATGYVVNDSSPAELILAVETLAAGGSYVHPSAGAAMAEQLAAGSTPGVLVSGPGGQLTKREVEVLGELAAGLTNAETGQKLFLSVRTVENHRAHIFQKLGVSSRAELVRRAIEADLIR
ncbi:MAG TPA: response regulator transcription factor [Candidatus Solibacter sp.]|jgi:two-component system response regulator NreC|nr:response regulator transcription factor [Candidatus Solibacter sp.]